MMQAAKAEVFLKGILAVLNSQHYERKLRTNEITIS